jgi:hypothetical protein
MRLLRQLAVVFTALGILASIILIFSFDILKIEYVVFMEIQPSFDDQEAPLAVPARSIPVDGYAYVPNTVPENPVPADESSVARGAQLYQINCAVCHGVTGTETTTVSSFFVKVKPTNLASEQAQSLSDGEIFLTITNGKFNPNNSLFPDVQFSGQCPPLNENLTIRERWDIVNFIRTLAAQ